MKVLRLNLLAVLAMMPLAVSSAQTGPVATACKDDIAQMCAGKAHDGEVRICLESNYDKVSAACKKALDSTGGGRGKGFFGKAK
jgi:hypothetical protein